MLYSLFTGNFIAVVHAVFYVELSGAGMELKVIPSPLHGSTHLRAVPLPPQSPSLVLPEDVAQEGYTGNFFNFTLL